MTQNRKKTSSPDDGSSSKPPSDRLLVLHIDDDPFQLDRVKAALEGNPDIHPFQVQSVETAEEFLAAAKQPLKPAIILLDIHIDETANGGIQLARQARKLCADAAILMCSNADDGRTIAKCLAAGADDFISKESDRGELSLRVWHSYQLACAKRGVSLSPSLATSGSNSSAASPDSPPAYAGKTLTGIIRRIPGILTSAVSSIHVKGESGVGKELVAEMLAAQLPRGTPFIKVNCGAIAPTLLESELFGHVKGAFTGAARDRRGHLEQASGGWIFLDEVTTLSLPAQAAMLRAIENQEVTPLGSSRPVKIKVRFISASNEPIEELVAQSKFRQDLWQRLCEAEVQIPPLRERQDEIPELIEHFLNTMAGGPYRITKTALDILVNVPWTNGNVRELRNCLRAMTEFQIDRLLTPLGIPDRILKHDSDRDARDLHSRDVHPLDPDRPNHTVKISFPAETPFRFDDLEDRLFAEVLAQIAKSEGKQSLRAISRLIGMARSTISERGRRLITKGFLTPDELARMINVIEAGE